MLLERAERRKKNIEPFNIDFGGRVATYVDRDLTKAARRDPKWTIFPRIWDISRTGDVPNSGPFLDFSQGFEGVPSLSNPQDPERFRATRH